MKKVPAVEMLLNRTQIVITVSHHLPLTCFITAVTMKGLADLTQRNHSEI